MRIENLDMVKEAVEAVADIIMLDNMTTEEMQEAIRNHRPQGPNRVFRKCDKGEHRQDYRAWCRLCFQRSADTFRTNPGYIAEESSRSINMDGQKGR